MEIRKTWGDRVCLVGNIDVDLLCRGSVADVTAAAGGLVEGMSRGGGAHILSSGNTITAAVKPENFRAMVESGRAASIAAGARE